MNRQKAPEVGDVFEFDFQSDMFCGSYRLVESLGGNRWIAEHVEPSDELIELIEAYYFKPGVYLDIYDPYGPNRREKTPQEAFDDEVLQRIERAGERFNLTFVQMPVWAEMF